VTDWVIIKSEVLTAKLSHCSNDNYEALKLQDFQGSFISITTKLSRPYSVFEDFPGPGKMDTFFKDLQGSWATLLRAKQQLKL